MRHPLAVVLALSSVHLVACGGGDDGVAPPPDGPPPVPPGCITHEVRAGKTVTVSGQVIDFATSDPVVGATVDLTTGWDVAENFPHPECPLIGTVTTGAEGRFGPIDVLAGSTQNPPVVVFLVRGGDRAPTVSDNRSCAAATCNLGHTIAAPSSALAASWRTDLATGGMTEADTRGLVAFTFKNADGGPAVGVAPSLGTLVTTPLTAGTQVRFVDATRSALMPVAQATTSSSGVALVGVNVTDKAAYVGGRRGNEAWAGTGCLVEPGFIFLEDKTVSPPP